MLSNWLFIVFLVTGLLFIVAAVVFLVAGLA